MNTLDSRSLRVGDCFAQKFATEGEVRYFVSSGSDVIGARARAEQKEGFVLEVRPKKSGGAAAQHNVSVSRKGDELTVSPEKLSIEVGDFVLWHTQDSSLGGFSVAGEGPKTSFSSFRIQGDAVFTHAFGTPGKYQWMDPLGSKVAGIVEVRAFEARSQGDHDRWYEMLSKPEGFEITSQESRPKAVEIIVGQTVFWSVQKTSGVAIVDARLLPQQPKKK